MRQTCLRPPDAPPAQASMTEMLHRRLLPRGSQQRDLPLGAVVSLKPTRLCLTG